MLTKLMSWFKESWRSFQEASVHTTLWVEGYTDHEIEDELKRIFPEKR